MDKPKSPGTQARMRWYDKHDGLAEALEVLKVAERKRREDMLEKMKEIITKKDPQFIDKCCEKFPLNPFKRRWYDSDPYLWLIINSLRYTDDETRDEIVALINKF